jgi:hypothetical protein
VLRSVDWQLDTSVLEQPLGSISKCQITQCLTLEVWSDRLFRNVGK